MKFILVVMVSVFDLGLVGCGNKDSSSSSNSISRDPYKVSSFEAQLDAQTGSVQVGTTHYTVSQQSIQVMMQAFQQAQMQGIQPTAVNGSYKFKVRITGYLTGGQQQYQQGGYQQPYQQGYQQSGYQTGYNQPYSNELVVTQAVIHR